MVIILGFFSVRFFRNFYAYSNYFLYLAFINSFVQFLKLVLQSTIYIFLNQEHFYIIPYLIQIPTDLSLPYHQLAASNKNLKYMSLIQFVYLPQNQQNLFPYLEFLHPVLFHLKQLKMYLLLFHCIILLFF